MNRPLSGLLLALTAQLSFTLGCSGLAWAQGGIPLPGQTQMQQPQATSAPVPGAHPQAPPPGPTRTNNAPSAQSAYQQLPLTPEDAQVRLDELKTLLPDARPQEIQDSIMQICEWLAEMADSHYKISLSFAKNEATKPQAEAEKAAAHRFSQLKNQALLLKADLLIKQRRFPEALGPLVDIIGQEPRSATGQTAYKRLKEIGFSQEPELKQESKIEPAATPLPAQTPPKPSTAAAKPAVVTAAPAAATPPPQNKKVSQVPVKTKVAVKPALTPQAKPQKKAPAKGPTVWISGSPYGGGSGRQIGSNRAGQVKR